MAVAGVSNTHFASDAHGQSNRGAMTMVTTLFFIWGFATVLNDALIPHLQTIFNLDYLHAMFIQLAFFGGYFIFAQPAGKLIEWIGYQRSMVVGLLLMAAGAILFFPAASIASYNFFLAAQVVLAAGITVLQVAANPYVTILGPPETASSRLNLTQAFNTFGDVLAPFVGSFLILGGAAATATASRDQLKLGTTALLASRAAQVANVKIPYLAFGGILILLALAIAFYKFPRIEVTRDFRPGEAAGSDRESIWDHPHLYLGAIGIFIYVGAEVAIGSFLVKFLADPTIGNLPLAVGARYVALYWGGMMVGRFVGSALMQRMRANVLLAWAAVGAAILVACAYFGTGHFAMWTVILVGIFNSIMFPTIFTLGVADLGHLTSKGSGLLIQAIVGGAGVPVLLGFFADRIGVHHALFLPFLCYLYIMYYGWRGYRIKPTEHVEHLQAV